MKKKIWDTNLIEWFCMALFYTAVMGIIIFTTVIGFQAERPSWIMYTVGMISSLVFLAVLCYWIMFFKTLHQNIKEKQEFCIHNPKWDPHILTVYAEKIAAEDGEEPRFCASTINLPED